MELVIGGAYQGKLEYVLNLTGLTAHDVFDASILCQILYNDTQNSDSKIFNSNVLNSKVMNSTVLDFSEPNSKVLNSSVTNSKIIYSNVSNGNVSMIQECDMIDKLELYLKKPILNHFHLFVKSFFDHQIDPYPIMNHIRLNHKDLIIISDEIGCGIVPLSSSDRAYRETTGRILCSLAKDAHRVHRVIAGLGTIIKED